MKIQYRDMHGAHCSAEIPDGHQFNMFLLAVINAEILKSIEGRLRNYSYATYPQIRAAVSPQVSGAYLKNIISVWADNGMLRLDDQGRVTSVDPDWRETELA